MIPYGRERVAAMQGQTPPAEAGPLDPYAGKSEHETWQNLMRDNPLAAASYRIANSKQITHWSQQIRAAQDALETLTKDNHK